MNDTQEALGSDPAARFAKALAVIAHGLPNVFDESTDYFHGFTAPFASDVALAPESFKQALKVGAGYQIDFRPGSDFFDAAREYGEPESKGFALLEKVMNATLSEVTVAFARKAGVVRVRMWLFGKLDAATLVGLKSEATET
jgi:hypothetical protein